MYQIGTAFFFPSVTEQGRGNALRIHTRTQTTDSLLWGSSVLITIRSLLLETPGPCFSASHSTDSKAQAASSPCNKALSLAGWFVKSSFHWVKILQSFPFQGLLPGGGWEKNRLRAVLRRGTWGCRWMRKRPASELQGEWTLVSVGLECQKHLFPAQWFSFKRSFNGSSSINTGGFENSTLKILCVPAAAAWTTEKPWGFSPVAFPHLL